MARIIPQFLSEGHFFKHFPSLILLFLAILLALSCFANAGIFTVFCFIRFPSFWIGIHLLLLALVWLWSQSLSSMGNTLVAKNTQIPIPFFSQQAMLSPPNATLMTVQQPITYIPQQPTAAARSYWSQSSLHTRNPSSSPIQMCLMTAHPRDTHTVTEQQKVSANCSAVKEISRQTCKGWAGVKVHTLTKIMGWANSNTKYTQVLIDLWYRCRLYFARQFSVLECTSSSCSIVQTLTICFVPAFLNDPSDTEEDRESSSEISSLWLYFPVVYLSPTSISPNILEYTYTLCLSPRSKYHSPNPGKPGTNSPQTPLCMMQTQFQISSWATEKPCCWNSIAPFTNCTRLKQKSGQRPFMVTNSTRTTMWLCESVAKTWLWSQWVLPRVQALRQSRNRTSTTRLPTTQKLVYTRPRLQVDSDWLRFSSSVLLEDSTMGLQVRATAAMSRIISAAENVSYCTSTQGRLSRYSLLRVALGVDQLYSPICWNMDVAPVARVSSPAAPVPSTPRVDMASRANWVPCFRLTWNSVKLWAMPKLLVVTFWTSASCSLEAASVLSVVVGESPGSAVLFSGVLVSGLLLLLLLPCVLGSASALALQLQKVRLNLNACVPLRQYQNTSSGWNPFVPLNPTCLLQLLGTPLPLPLTLILWLGASRSSTCRSGVMGYPLSLQYAVALVQSPKTLITSLLVL